MKNVYDINQEFERKLSEYTGAPFVITTDNQSNALFLALYYEKNIKKSLNGVKKLQIPCRTYPSVPCEIIHAGFEVDFQSVKGDTIKGSYQLSPSNVYDSALSFTHNMYKKGTHMCVSFTGPYKHFKLGKGGAILTDDEHAYFWFKRAKYSGRRECSYHEDNLDMLGWNFYMPIETSARGFHMFPQLYTSAGHPKQNEDLELSYPDLSQFPVYSQKQFNLQEEVFEALMGNPIKGDLKKMDTIERQKVLRNWVQENL